jgi:hypothetical protein
MTANSQESQAPVAQTSDKEMNFRKLEAKYQAEIERERSARLDLERKMQESQKPIPQDDENDNEPYVDHRKLNKTLAKFGEQTKQQTQTDIQRAVNIAIQEERKANWLKSNSDFYEVLQHAEKLALKNPDLAESILEMPDGFERQKLVYKTIKSQGLHQPEQKAPSIQDKVDANRRGPFYQPSSVGTAPYAGSAADFSPNGQKEAHAKMIALKERMRLG